MMALHPFGLNFLVQVWNFAVSSLSVLQGLDLPLQGEEQEGF